VQLRFLDLDDHLGRREHLFGRFHDGCARGFVVRVGNADTDAGIGFHDDLVAFGDDLVHTGGRHANAELEGLDFFWYANLHGALPGPGLVSLSREDTRVRRALACEMRDFGPVFWQFLRSIRLYEQYSAMALDRYDKLILKALQKDGRISNVQLAAAVNLSESACLRRVRTLEESGIIDRYAALLSQKKVGLPGSVFVQIGLHREEERELAAFEGAVKSIPEVMECYLMTGEFDYLLRVVVADMADFERLHRDALTRLPGVARVNSSVTIRTVQKKTELPLH